MKTILLFILLFSLASKANICQHYQKFLDSGINPDALNHALTYFKKNKEKHALKDDFVLIADYSLNSSKKRFYILNLKTGNVIQERVSHGSGKITLYRPAETTEEMMYVERLNGETAHNGDFNKCKIAKKDLERINKNRTSYNRRAIHERENLTRPGFFKTAEPYISASHIKENRPKGRHHWWPLTEEGHNGVRLDGLSEGVNHKARSNGVVLHEATYNLKYAGIMGRSYGCPAFEKGILKNHLDKIKNGRLFYSHVSQCEEDMELVLKEIKNEVACSTKNTSKLAESQTAP